MQITTLKELSEVGVNHTLFLINPFGNGNQRNVTIEKFTVQSFSDDKFKGIIEIKDIDVYRSGDHYFVDMLSGCKYVYTLKNEAESKLKEIHKGLHSNEVSEHHSSCNEMARVLGMGY